MGYRLNAAAMQPGAAWRMKPASDEQRKLVRSLVEERWPRGTTAQARWEDFLDTHDERFATALRGDMSDMIGWLKAQPKPAYVAASQPSAMPASVPAPAPAPVTGTPAGAYPHNGVRDVSTHTHQPTQKPGWFPEAGTFYLVDHKIYKVFMGKRPYAKELVLYPHDSDPKKKKGKFEYVRGAIRMIPGPEYALTPQQAVILGHAFGFCAYCGTELDDPNSVKRGVGPHCWKKYHLPALARMSPSA